jgi:hypothetical protein
LDLHSSPSQHSSFKGLHSCPFGTQVAIVVDEVVVDGSVVVSGAEVVSVADVAVAELVSVV